MSKRIAHREHFHRLKRDLLIVALSVVAAIILVKIGVVQTFLTATHGSTLISSFISGLFFTSMFTIAPAAVAFVQIAEAGYLPLIALSGAIGATLTDLVIFSFIKDSFADDLKTVLRQKTVQKIAAFFHLGFLRWIAPVIGALIIASPLPDELGLAFMGITKVRRDVLILIAFPMNFIGILLLGLAARAI